MKVDLVDINDNRPAFYPVSYAVSLSTQSAPGTSVVRVMAYDPDSDENGRITYKTVPGGASPYFTLNKDTGWYKHLACFFHILLCKISIIKQICGELLYIMLLHYVSVCCVM